MKCAYTWVMDKYKERFLQSFQESNGCWNWTKAKNKAGYGFYTVRKAGWKRRRTVLAHRYAYEAFIDVVPDNMCVLHKCDNPSCVNPNHLFLGTQADNMQDRKAKGRMNKGKDGRFISNVMKSATV
jgi:hypothetical protein